MSVIYNEIQNRHGRRCDIEAAAKKLKPPSIHSKASKQDFTKLINGLTEDFLEECLLITHDFKVLRLALHNIAADNPSVDIECYIKQSWDLVPMDEEKKNVLDLKAVEEAEAREKAAKSDKKQGELDGQLKLFDDGSTPEAGECLTIPECASARKPPTFDEIVEAMENCPETQIHEIASKTPAKARAKK